MLRFWQILRKYTDADLVLPLLAVVIMGLYPPFELIIYRTMLNIFFATQVFGLQAIGFLIIFALYGILLIPLESYYDRFIKVNVAEFHYNLHHRLIQSSMVQPLQWRDSQMGESMLSQSIGCIQQNLPQKTIEKFFALIKSLCSIAVYLWLISTLGWTVIGLIALILFLLGLATYLCRTLPSEMPPEARQATRLRSILCDLNNHKEIQLYQGYNYLSKQWTLLYNNYKKSKLLSLRKNLFGFIIVALLATALIGVLLFNGLTATAAGVFSLVDLILLLFVLIRLHTQTRILVHAYFEFKQGKKKCTTLFAVIDMKEEKEQIKEVELEKSKKTGFELRNVSFSYPDTDRQVLQNISFSIKPGETVAIVGENGSGKSTLAKLMLGLYYPQTGEILLDGLPLVRTKEMSAVFQDHINYQLTVRQNIGFGDLSKLGDDQSIFQAAKKADALEIIRRKDLRLDDTLGDRFGKTGLSGGEWQSIAIARGFMGDKEILLIDEPTASLDPFREVKLLSRYLEYKANKTIMIISHRLLVASLVDKIVVLKAGRLIEVGSHSDLLLRKGYYWTLWHKQTRWYDESGDVAKYG